MAGANINTRVDGGEESIDTGKRNTLVGLGVLAVGVITGVTGRATSTLAGEVEGNIKLASADIPKLDIDYTGITDPPLSEKLAAGEEEFLTNAVSEYGEDVGDVWLANVQLIADNDIYDGLIDELKLFAPDLLVSFADLPDKYPLLQSIGENMKSKGMLQRSEKLARG